MLYVSLAWCARRALQWCYREVCVVGTVPAHGPLLLAVNHPNDLPDVCLVLAETPRRVSFVANVSASEQPLVGWVFRTMGVVPVHRVRDARKARARGEDSAQANARAFAQVRELLLADGCVCVFPEGGVHPGPGLGALRVGLARMALDARDVGGVRGLQILPIGITYEAPSERRSRVQVAIGVPLAMDEWQSETAKAADVQLTSDIRARLLATSHDRLLAGWAGVEHRKSHERSAWRAPLAVVGLLLHAPAWLAIEWMVQRSSTMADEIMARRILPGLFVMAAWYVALVFGCWRVVATLATRTTDVGSPARDLPLAPAVLATVCSALFLIALPALGTAGLRWRDAQRDRAAHTANRHTPVP